MINGDRVTVGFRKHLNNTDYIDFYLMFRPIF